MAKNTRKTRTIHRNELKALLDSLGNRYFGVTYTTRTNDKTTGLPSVKRMTATRAFQKWTVGGESAYDAEAKGLYTVADCKALVIGLAKVASGEAVAVKPIRSFGLEGVLEVRANGIVYTITDQHPEECSCQTCDPDLYLVGK